MFICKLQCFNDLAYKKVIINLIDIQSKWWSTYQALSSWNSLKPKPRGVFMHHQLVNPIFKP
jgi:hypothetical protein